MSFVSIFKNIFQEKKEGPKEKRTKREKVLEFIENNSVKSNFLHWLLNNTGIVLSEKDDWEEIKKELINNPRASYSLLRSYSVTLKQKETTKEALQEVAEEAEKAERVARELTFLGRFKKFSIAVGGALLFLGIIKIIIAALILFDVPQILSLFNPYVALALAAFLVTAGIIDLLGGIFLIAM